MSVDVNLNGIDQLILDFDGTTTAVLTAPGEITITNSNSGVYSLGGALSSGNISLGAGAGTGATASIVGLDGNHQVTITTGSAPSPASTLFTVTFTTSRGHNTYPVMSLVTSVVFASGQGVTPVGGSDTSYSVGTLSVPLASSTIYIFDVSCP